MSLPLSEAVLHDVITEGFAHMLEDGIARGSDVFEFVNKAGPNNSKGVVGVAKNTPNNSAQRGFPVGGPINTPGAMEPIEYFIPYGNYSVSFELAHKQLVEIDLADSRGEAIVANFLEEQMSEMVMSVLDLVNQDIMSGSVEATTNGTILGLDQWIDDSNTIGGVNRGSVTNFAPFVLDNGGGGNVTLTEDLMDDAFDGAINDTSVRAMRPELITCDVDHWHAIAKLTGGNSVSLQGNVNAGGEGMLPRITKFVGVEMLVYRGVPVVHWTGYTANRIDFWRPSAYRLRSLQGNGELAGMFQPFNLDGQRIIESHGDRILFKLFGYGQSQLMNARKNSFSLQEVEP